MLTHLFLISLAQQPVHANPDKVALTPPQNHVLIEQMLSARHPEDLPDAAQWAQTNDAEEGLLWMASNGRLDRHRQRALAALRFFESDSTRTVLLEKAASTRHTPLVRAGAMEGLQGQQLADQDCVRVAQINTQEDERLAALQAQLLASDTCKKVR